MSSLATDLAGSGTHVKHTDRKKKNDQDNKDNDNKSYTNNKK